MDFSKSLIRAVKLFSFDPNFDDNIYCRYESFLNFLHENISVLFRLQMDVPTMTDEVFVHTPYN